MHFYLTYKILNINIFTLKHKK